jgi:hypothetical protein
MNCLILTRVSSPKTFHTLEAKFHRAGTRRFTLHMLASLSPLTHFLFSTPLPVHSLSAAEARGPRYR